jgi:hypothetical protein
MDIAGKEILRKEIILNSGRNEIELNDLSLSVGYYFLIIRNPLGEFEHKFIITD